jgi:hypothetical protein
MQKSTANSQRILRWRINLRLTGKNKWRTSNRQAPGNEPVTGTLGYSQVIHSLSSIPPTGSADLKGKPFMLALLASLVMAGAGAVAVAAIAITMRAQLPAVRKVLADSRTIAQDRAYLIQLVGGSQPAAIALPGRARRLPARAIKPVRAASAAPLRAAA